MSGAVAKDISGLSDADFLNEFATHAAELAVAPENSKVSVPGVQEETQPSGNESEGDTGSSVTGGADDEQHLDDKIAGAGSSSEKDEVAGGNDKPSTDTSNVQNVSHQETETGEATSGDVSKSTPAIGAEAELAQLLAPLKAAKRTINIGSVEQARQLMQMGIDYSRKMADMKPYQRVFKTLERANLLDEDKLNFLIDLANKRPEAVKKLLKDSEIDPMDLDLENNEVYKPNDHMIGERELAVDVVLDEIRPSPKFNTVVDVVSKWDTASKRSLMDNPVVLKHLAAHMEAGIYDQIIDRVETEKIFGKLTGLSDLEAYKAVGDAMHTEGAFGKANLNGATPPAGGTNQGHSQDSQGSDESVKARKRAASPPKGSAGQVQKKMPNFLGGMTDEEIEKFDWRSAL